MSLRSYIRRHFLKSLGVGAASLALPGPAMGRVRPTQQRKKYPNLLIIHTDQLSCWALSIYAKQLTRTPNYGRVLVQTPHIDSLAKAGPTYLIDS